MFGYAAGMVSEPHPKPAQPAAQATPTKANPGVAPQRKGKSPEKGKESKSLLPYLQDSPGQSQPPPQQFNYRQPTVPQPPPQQQRMSGWHRATAQQEETTEDDDSDDSDSDEDEDGDDDEEETDVESAYQYEGSDYNSEDTSGRGGRARGPPSAKGRLRTGPHKEYVKEPSRKKGTAQVTKPKKKKRPAPEDKRSVRALQDRQWEREQQRLHGEYDDRDRRREPSDRDQRRYTYTEDREEVRRPAYRHERSYSERDRKLEYDDELDAPRRRSPTKSAPSRDLDWPQERRRDGPSPQRGIRNMPQRRSGPGRRYSDEEDEEGYDDDEDDHYRREEQRRAKHSRERGWNDDPRHGRGTGLPQPPPMVRDVGGREGDAIRRKVKKVPIRDFDDEEDERNMALRFASFKVNNGDRSPNSSNGSGGNWPNNLPRLPRTPGGGTPGAGSANSGGEGGYFDTRPNGVSTSAAASSSGSGFRGRTVIHPRENLRNIDLDDSPPRPSSTILRSPSPATSTSSAFSQRRALPQPQGQPYDGPLSSAGEQLQRRRSLYSMPSKQQQQSEPSARERRPQSQMYASSNVDHAYSEQSRQRHDTQPSFSMQSKPQIFGPHPTRIQPQTPAPPRSVNIESPAPIGGRERMADIPRIEQGGEDHHGKRHDGLPTINVDSPRISHGGMDSAPPSIPMINIDSGSNNSGPQINISGPQINVEPAESRQQGSRKEVPRVQVYEIPGVSVSGPEYDDGPNIKVSGPMDDGPRFRGQQQQRPQSQSQFGGASPSRRGGLLCGGCNGPIIGRIVSAMGSRWHPQCFRCTVCEELLEHVSSYEHDGRPYCHLDYHEVSCCADI